MNINKTTAGRLILIAALLSTGPVSATDWQGCGFEFETIARKARDQAFAAQEMSSIELELDSKRMRVESARIDYENCRADPDTFDFLGDGCQSYYYEYQAAVDDHNSSVETYNSSLELFKLELDSFGRAVKALEYSCGASF